MELTSDLSNVRCCVLQVSFNLTVDPSLGTAKLNIQNTDHGDVSGLLQDPFAVRLSAF